jgi:hypothetical protein
VASASQQIGGLTVDDAYVYFSVNDLVAGTGTLAKVAR